MIACTGMHRGSQAQLKPLEKEIMSNIVGDLSSYATRSNSTRPRTKFKDRSPVIWKHSVNMTTRAPLVVLPGPYPVIK